MLLFQTDTDLALPAKYFGVHGPFWLPDNLFKNDLKLVLLKQV